MTGSASGLREVGVLLDGDGISACGSPRTAWPIPGRRSLYLIGGRNRLYELEYFLLQLAFANRAGIVCGLSFEEASIRFTSFVRQFRERGCVWQSQWDYDTPPAIVAWTFFDLHRRDQLAASSVSPPFGPFDSWHDREAGSLRLRFVNGPHVLGSAQQTQRMDELKRMFSSLGERYDRDTCVTGFSWLYNLQAYSRLFPTAFIEAAQPVPRWFSSGARWGQVAAGDGRLRHGIGPTLLSSANAALDIDALDRCFQFSALTLRAPLSAFVDFYDSPR